MLQVEQLWFSYPHGKPIFQGFDWKVKRGETWSILGSSGCGKTTLLYLLAGLRQPTSGRVLIDGQLLIRPRPQTGLILQDYGLLPWATVRHNASLGLMVRDFYGSDGTHAPVRKEHVLGTDYWLERLGINSLTDKYPSQISGGQRQRVAIARTLAVQPDVLLMDEPFSSLDAATREDLQSLVSGLCVEHGITMIIVTHSIEEAALLGQNILLLNDPPNNAPSIFSNTQAGEPEYESSSAYQDICQRLREKMGVQ
ncbi:MAG: ABC transporter ATP-binding protein [Anaerolinea sp.]|nr:ABC transporter ATP-binding protein [Anaerolinea sp.]